MYKTIVAIAIVSVFAFTGITRAADEAKSSLSSKDEKFVKNAAAGGEMEVALGKFADAKATNADVKSFAQKMVADHSKANDELKALAQGKNYDLKKSHDSAIKMESKQEAKLGKKEGADFDKAYIDAMVKDHEKDVKEFKEASEESDDAELKAWAGKTLPTLQMHLDMAKDIQSKLGK